mmetsp:Transcript_75082/g.220000  ORF Transcript_75082/g.220000 Transcript_75082/m.220000 type:complete len:223 (+) Transcript_75082:972-1640(+)
MNEPRNIAGLEPWQEVGKQQVQLGNGEDGISGKRQSTQLRPRGQRPQRRKPWDAIISQIEAGQVGKFVETAQTGQLVPAEPQFHQALADSACWAHRPKLIPCKGQAAQLLAGSEMGKDCQLVRTEVQDRQCCEPGRGDAEGREAVFEQQCGFHAIKSVQCWRQLLSLLAGEVQHSQSVLIVTDFADVARFRQGLRTWDGTCIEAVPTFRASARACSVPMPNN